MIKNYQQYKTTAFALIVLIFAIIAFANKLISWKEFLLIMPFVGTWIAINDKAFKKTDNEKN